MLARAKLAEGKFRTTFSFAVVSAFDSSSISLFVLLTVFAIASKSFYCHNENLIRLIFPLNALVSLSFFLAQYSKAFDSSFL